MLYKISQGMKRVIILGVVLVGLICLQGISPLSAQARGIDNPEDVVQAERLSAVISCLPKQLSEPDLGRALSEFGNDYLERTFLLKDNPKISEAEVEFSNCLENKGYTLRAEQVRDEYINSNS